MILHLAIRWILGSWNNEVTNITIYNCYSKVYSSLISNLPSNSNCPLGITELYKQVTEAGRIENPMAILNFLNPVEEEVDEEKDGQNLGEVEVLQEVLEEYLGL